MLDEAREAPDAVARLLAADGDGYLSLGSELRERPPQALLTIARGSSDHAAHYMAYLIMARFGRLVTSLPMSLVTLYGSRIQCDGLVSFAFSQSGQSHDLVVPTRLFRDGGARTIAFVNDATSPLADAAQWAFDLHAGTETSIAATKSYIAQLVAGARVVAAWQSDAALRPPLGAEQAHRRERVRRAAADARPGPALVLAVAVAINGNVLGDVIDLVVLDVMMPYMDGFEVLQNLKKNPNTRDIPVIMLTAKAQDADVFRGWQSGVDCYLTKPFNPMELIAFVRRIFKSLDDPGDGGGRITIG